MNKKVFVSMLVLSIVFLVGMYVLKIFFPQEFVLAIQNERIIAIGQFIDSHEWLYYICCGVTAFVTYYLYCCACSGKLWLKWYECMYIVIAIVLVRVVSFYDENMWSILSWCSFIVLPALMSNNLKRCALIFSVHTISQGLSLKIRGLAMYLATNNFVTVTLLAIDMYLWLLLFYVIFNYKKKEV